MPYGEDSRKNNTPGGLYRDQRIVFTKNDFSNGSHYEEVHTYGGGWHKNFDKNGLLTWEEWVYTDAQGQRQYGQQTHNPPIKDQHPGIVQGAVITDYNLGPPVTTTTKPELIEEEPHEVHDVGSWGGIRG